MVRNENNWDNVFLRYKESNLSQRAFCAINDVSLNQFKYRLYERRLKSKTKTETPVTKINPIDHTFEQIDLVSAEQTSGAPLVKLAIHLPSQIHLEIHVNLYSPDFSYLIKQLVNAC